MILDSNLVLSDGQAITVTAISENVIAWPATGIVAGEAAAMRRNLGAGRPLPILLQVIEDFATLTSLTVTLETSAAAALTSSTVLATTGAIPVASLVAGYRTTMPFMPDATMLAYFGLRYTVTGTTATAGAITAAVGTQADSN